MLFHVTMTHSANNCPGYRDTMADVVNAISRMDATAKELKIKVLSYTWGAPDHVAFAVLEADDIAAIGRFLFLMPFRQDFRVTPVQNIKDFATMAKAMM